MYCMVVTATGKSACMMQVRSLVDCERVSGAQPQRTLHTYNEWLLAAACAYSRDAVKN